MAGYRDDEKIHGSFLSYRERHVYFGRGDRKVPLTLEEFGALFVERERIRTAPKEHRTAELHARLVELESLLLLD